MSNVALRFFVPVVVLMGLAGAVSAQQAPLVTLTPLPPAPALNGTVLYNGGTASADGLSLAAWGGGAISEDATTSYAPGTESIKIESPGFYQGGQITFSKPVSLSGSGKYLQFVIKLASDPKFVTPSANTNGPGGPGGYPNMGRPRGYPGGMGPRGYPGGGGGGQQFQPGGNNGRDENFTGSTSSLFHLAQNPYQPGPGGPPRGYPGGMPPGMGGFPGAGGYPGAGGMRGPGAEATQDVPAAPPAFPANYVHLIFTLSDGTQTDAVRSLPAPAPDQQWVTISMPVSKIQLPAGSTALNVNSVAVCTDTPTLINVGQVALVTDSTPITCSTGGTKIVAVGEDVVFNGTASGGASMLKYSWDFDTKGTFTDQAEGPYATHTYAAAGAYTVTLVVSDVDGIKSPATATTVIHVEQ